MVGHVTFYIVLFHSNSVAVRSIMAQNYSLTHLKKKKSWFLFLLCICILKLFVIPYYLGAGIVCSICILLKYFFCFVFPENAEEAVKEICCKSCANIQINQPASLANTLLVLCVPFNISDIIFQFKKKKKKTPFCDILEDFSENKSNGVEMWYNSYLRTLP